MKNVFLLLGLLFFTFTLTAQQEKITIKFIDGTEITGYGSVRDDSSILFRKEKKAEKEIYSHKTERKARKLTIHTDNGDMNYEYKVIAGTSGIGSVMLLEIAKKGAINLYIKTSFTDSNPGMNSGTVNMTYSSVKYFMGKKGDDLVANLGNGSTYSKKFRKQIAPKYFKDCPDLLDKINTKEFFGRHDIEAVIRYYNEKCK